MPASRKGCRTAALWIFVCIACARVADAQALPTPWVSRDIGGPVITGSTIFNAPDGFTITAGGAGISGTSDQFQFVYVAVPGNIDVRARVDAITRASIWSKAGVMIRSSLSPGAAHGFALVSYGKGLAFQRRPSDGGLSLQTAGEFAAAPRWVRLVRLGNVVTSYSSIDGVTWTTMGSETIQLGATAYVGIAATSHNALAPTIATVSRVWLTLPSNMPAGQANVDIGLPAFNGSATYSAGTYTIAAGGTDIWSTADQFHYVYQPAAGDLDVKVRIASVSYADRSSKAGVMIRASLDADSSHAFALVSAGQGYGFHRRNTRGDLTIGTSGSSGAPPGWLRLKRSGSLITAYQSADGVNWTAIGSDSIVAGDQVYVGIAATSHTATGATTVQADHFSVVQSPPPNQPPAVSLATNGTTFTAPASVTLTASASDPENQLERVEFYAGTTLIGSDTTAPYVFSWTGVAAGSYAVNAVAYDTAGASGASATVTITVAAAALPPPTAIVFTASTDHATVISYLLEVFANGANPDTAAPVASSDLGKPAPAANGDITVNRATLFSALAPGTYVATVSSIGDQGRSRSASLTFTR